MQCSATAPCNAGSSPYEPCDVREPPFGADRHMNASESRVTHIWRICAGSLCGLSQGEQHRVDPGAVADFVEYTEIDPPCDSTAGQGVTAFSMAGRSPRPVIVVSTAKCVSPLAAGQDLDERVGGRGYPVSGRQHDEKALCGLSGCVRFSLNLLMIFGAGRLRRVWALMGKLTAGGRRCRLRPDWPPGRARGLPGCRPPGLAVAGRAAGPPRRLPGRRYHRRRVRR